jgi:hypothetical protein
MLNRSPPPPPDVLQILQDVVALQRSAATNQMAVLNAVAALSRQLTALTAHLDNRLDAIEAAETQIEGDLNPAVPFVPPMLLWSNQAMAFVTAINPTTAVPSSVIFQDSSAPPRNFPGSQITFSALTGAAAPGDVAATLASDGVTFTFTPSGTQPTETVTQTATWTDPTGVQAPLSLTYTINLVAAVVAPVPFVPPMQMDLTAGA